MSEVSDKTMYTAEKIIENRKRIFESTNSNENDKGYINAVAEHIKDNPQLQKQIIDNPEYLIEMCFCIVDKDKKVRPFFFNAVQKDFIGRLNKAITDFRDGKLLSIKFQILKGRQQG